MDIIEWNEVPNFDSARMLVGFSGWMDGGEVSTGTVRYMTDALSTVPVAEIDPQPFYTYNVAGPMEVASMFRPTTRIENGVVEEFSEPVSRFYAVPDQQLVLFQSREPNMNWRKYADAILSVAEACHVDLICFVGSVSGLLPHTRPPYFYSAVSEPKLVPWVVEHGLNPTDYAGPASFVTLLVTQARARGIRMVSIVAGAPAYVQGRNEKCIEATVRKSSEMLELSVDVSDLEERSQQFESGLDAVVAKRPDLASHIQKLERAYDNQVAYEVTGEDKDDMQAWFDKQNLRPDQD